MKKAISLALVLITALTFASCGKHSHDDAENLTWITIKEPTCTEVGVKELKCNICEEVIETADVDKCEHNFCEWEVIEEAKCEEKSLLERHCLTCGFSETKRSNFAKSHEYGDAVVISEPTCTKRGEKQRTCAVCGYVDSDWTPTVSHEWKQIKEEITKQPTFDACYYGIKTITEKCVSCGQERTKTVKIESLDAKEKSNYSIILSHEIYNDISRSADKYKYLGVIFKGKIVQVCDESAADHIAIYRIATDNNNYFETYDDDIIYVQFANYDSGNRFLDGDIVKVYGIMTGLKTYTTILGSSITIPECITYFIELVE